MPLRISAAHYSATGPREANEDFGGFVVPAGDELARKGFAAVVADGVSGADGGRETAEHCARNVLADYYSTPDNWEVSQALDRIYQALNRWVQTQARSRQSLVGMATTLTGLVLRGNAYYFSHVGDTRLLLWRPGAPDAVQQLTTDHVWQRPEMEHVLTRAVGLDSKLAVDHGWGPLHAGDVFALVSDGVWAKVAPADMAASLRRLHAGDGSADDCARALVRTALDLGGTDNATAVVVRVDEIDAHGLRDSLHLQRDLPALPRLAVGDCYDGLTVLEALHESRVTLLYRVQDAAGRQLVLKTLTETAQADAHERLAFAHENWLARRAVARFFVQVVEPATPPSALYALTTWHAGATLGQQLAAGRHYTLPEALRIGMDLARALGALHRRSIVHRDVKPDNVHLGDDGQLRLLDLGVAVSGFDVAELAQARRAGTPSYLAPELFADGSPTARSDLYAWGVTLYHLLTRRFPFGEVEPFQTPRFGDPAPPSRWRHDIPGWLEHVLLRALAVEPEARFETAEELLLALEQGPLAQAAPIKRRPLATRNLLRTWQVVALVSLAANVALLVAWLA